MSTVEGIKGVGECSGSFGEILQGVLPDGKKFLVNLKIKNRSLVAVWLTGCGYSQDKEERFAAAYRKYSKTCKVLRNILTDIGRHDDLMLDVEANIPVGKGLSSSTADMVAAVRAMEQCLSISFKDEYVSRMLTEIEPNDGLHYEGTCAYRHTVGERIWNSPWVPPVYILGVDLGGELDTVEFNARQVEWTDAETARYAELLDILRRAYEEEDLEAVCGVATESALLWQKCIPRPELDRILALKDATGALGVVNTHSGTFLGLLYPADRKDVLDIRRLLQKEFPDRNIELYQSASC